MSTKTDMLTLYKGDCIELLASGAGVLPDESVSCVYTDLPFGTTAARWDTCVDHPALFGQLVRVMKRGAPLLIHAVQPFTTLVLGALMAWGPGPRVFRHELVWESPNGTAGGAIRDGRRIAPMKCHSSILVCTLHGEGLAYYNPQYITGEPYNAEGTWQARDVGDTLAGSTTHGGKRRKHTANPTGRRWPRSVLRAEDFPHDARQGWDPAKGRYKVPGGPSTQKPQSVLRYLLETYCPPGGLVLDPTAGSGSTLAAAHAVGRNAVGFEMRAAFVAAALDAWSFLERGHRP